MTDNTQIDTTAHDACLSSIKPVKAWLAYFEPVKAVWVKTYGKLPTAAQYTAAVCFYSKRHKPGVECLSGAMHLRNEGAQPGDRTPFTIAATDSNIKGDGKAVGPANNSRKYAVAMGWVNEHKLPGSKLVRLVITPKGAQYIADVLAFEGAKAVETKAAAKKATPKADKPAKAPSKPAGEVAVVEATPVAAAETPVSEPDKANESQLADLAAHFNS